MVVQFFTLVFYRLYANLRLWGYKLPPQNGIVSDWRLVWKYAPFQVHKITYGRWLSLGRPPVCCATASAPST